MNRYIFIHRLTWPAILLLLGVVALLDQMHVVRMSIFVPLLLILLGLLKLAERAVLATEPAPETPYSVGVNPAANQAENPPQPAANVQADPAAAEPVHDFERNQEGGQQ